MQVRKRAAADTQTERIEHLCVSRRCVCFAASTATQQQLQTYLPAQLPFVCLADALKAKFSNQAFGALSHGEQSAALSNPDPFVFEELAALNKAYKAKHGFIFIICASGKSAPQMLEAIKQRVCNAPYTELGNAAREQMKITELRLEKLLSSQAASSGGGGGSSPAERAAVRTGQLAGHLAPTAAAGPAPSGGHGGPLRSPITTHVLDATLGRPAQGLPISLHRLMEGSQRMWDCLASGLTDADGRIGNLLPPAGWVAPGVYQMRFDTGAYLRACRCVKWGTGKMKGVGFHKRWVDGTDLRVVVVICIVCVMGGEGRLREGMCDWTENCKQRSQQE